MKGTSESNFLEVERKPLKCPVCGGKVLPIYFGYPIYPILQAEEHGKIIFGGRIIKPNAPDWKCTNCDMQFIKVKK